jgi:hypothetical protein
MVSCEMFAVDVDRAPRTTSGVICEVIAVDVDRAPRTTSGVICEVIAVPGPGGDVGMDQTLELSL